MTYAVQGARGAIPNPKAFGLRWRAMEKLLAKLTALGDEARELDFEYVQAEAYLHQLEGSEIDVLADALQSDGDPPTITQDIAKARTEVEALRKRAAILSRAQEKTNAALLGVVRENSAEWSAQVYERARQKADEVEEAVGRLRAAQAELSAFAALADWLERPEKSYGFGPGPYLVDTFEHRNVRLPDVLDAIVSDARETAATPDEKEKLRWAAKGATAQSIPGWVG